METPRITGITTHAVIAPLARPLVTASGSILSAPLVLIDVETDQGVVGGAYIFAYTPLALKPITETLAALGEMLAGETIAPVERSRAMADRFRLLGRQGFLGMALGGLDMCLWDAMGKTAGLSVARLLGGEDAPQIAYDSYGAYEESWGREAMERSVADGFDAVKIKLGVGDLAADRAMVRRVREVVGPDMKLMVDYNQSLTAPETVRRMTALEEEHDFYWLEEPVPAEDFAGHAIVRERVATPVQTGENWWFPEDAARAFQAEICDFAMPDLMKIGGVTGWRDTAGMAAAASVPVSSHLFPEASAHVLAATPGAHYLEVMDVAAAILLDPVEVEDGRVTPRGPGLGMEWGMRAVAKHAA